MKPSSQQQFLPPFPRQIVLTCNRSQIGFVLFVLAIAPVVMAPQRAFTQAAANTSREKVGDCLGSPVYRDDIATGGDTKLQDELFRLFLYPVRRRYYDTHQARLEPTQAEIDKVTDFFQKKRNGRDGIRKPTATELRLQLQDIQNQLTAEKLPERRRGHLKLKQQWVEQQLSELPTRSERILASVKHMRGTLESMLLVFEMSKIDKELANHNFTSDELIERWLRIEEIAIQRSTKTVSRPLPDDIQLANAGLERWIDGWFRCIEEYIATIQHALSVINDRFEMVVADIRKRGVARVLMDRTLTKVERDQIEFVLETIEFSSQRDRKLAESWLANWKFERHLFENFGGGRILWQQAGYEAFDATRRWLEAEEQLGNFHITDPKLREAFYRYWAHSHTPYMVDDVATIRHEFLEPEWASLRAK